MFKNRLLYLLFCVVILILGILSRQVSILPFFVGDILYSCLIYFGFRFLFPNQKTLSISIMTILFCFTIEFFQLYKATWLVNLRKTLLGHYILGEGFLFTDLICYLIGTLISSWFDKKSKLKSHSSNN